MPPAIGRHFFQDAAVDLGTSNTSIFVRGKGIVLRQPSIVARQKNTAELLYAGEEAKLLVGREPSSITTHYAP